MKAIVFCLAIFFTNSIYAQNLIGRYEVTKFDILEEVSLHDTLLMSKDSLQWINFVKSGFDSINIIFRENNLIDVLSLRYNATIFFKYPYTTKKQKNRNIKISGSSFRQFDTPYREKYRFRSVIRYLYGVSELSFINDNKIELLGYRYPFKYKIYLDKAFYQKNIQE